ncbi:MAG: Gfo/Idh/MocA family protein [bacterium]
MLRVGIIGMGIRGNLFALTVQYNPYAEVSAIAESDELRLKEAMERFKGQGYSDYRKMLEEEELDLVVVSLPDHLHREAVELAASKKRHVMIEKPLATSSADANAMVRAIKRAGVKAIVAFENRWNPAFVSAKESIDAGEVGDVRVIDTCLNDTIYVPTKMLSWAAKSTPGWFLLTHSIDMALWLTRKRVASVYATGEKKVLKGMGIDTYDWITAVLEFTDGTAGTFRTCWIYPESLPLVYDFRYEIVGTKGAISIDLRDQMIHKITDTYTHPPTLGRLIHGKPVGFAAEMLNSFIDNIRLDTKPLVDIDEGLYVAEIVDAIHRSLKRGRKEKV